MIKVFSSTDTVFSSNGDAVLKPFKARVHCEDNGDFYLELETDLKYLDYFVSGNILVANTPQGEQAFRISNIEKTRTRVRLKAWHVFYDSMNYLIADSYVVDKTCNDALDHLNTATEPQSAFTTISDVATSNSYRCVRNSLYEAIQTVLERWGGHLVRDNFNIAIRTSVGQDNGVTVRYAKNLKEITCTENWDKVVTQLLPVGRDGILLNAINQSESIYVTSSVQYDIPFTKTVSFEQNSIDEEDFKNSEGEVDEVALKQALVDDLFIQAQTYVEENSVPQVNYTLKAHLEQVTNIGDTIQVIDSRLGLNIMTNVIGYDYDCILGKYVELEFGNFTQKLSNLVSNITASVNSTVAGAVTGVTDSFTQNLEQATGEIWGTLGDSFVQYDGDKILVLDRLPASDAVNVIMINNGGIGFSQNGVNGTFTSALTIDGTLNMQAVNVINLVADMIKGGTLKLGSHLNESGILEVYDNVNNLVGQLDKDGLKMWGLDGSYLVINDEVGFCGYDRLGTPLFWVAEDEFHMKKSVVEEEITLSSKLRFIPITITENGAVTSDGVGLVSAATGGAS